jgi:hypothetical protein
MKERPRTLDEDIWGIETKKGGHKPAADCLSVCLSVSVTETLIPDEGTYSRKGRGRKLLLLHHQREEVIYSRGRETEWELSIMGTSIL